MTPPHLLAPSRSELLVSGLFELLAAAGAVRWSPTGSYANSPEPAGFVNVTPAATKAAVALTVYDETNDRDTGNGSDDVYVQVRVRGGSADPRDTDRLGDLLNDELGDLRDTALPNGLEVLRMTRTLRTAPTTDGTSRSWERADSYRVTVNPDTTQENQP